MQCFKLFDCLFVTSVPSPPINISISRECPYPWKLSWTRFEPAEWNLTSFEVAQRSGHSAEAVRWSVEVVDQEQLVFEVSLFSLNASEEYWFEVRSIGLDGAGNYSEAIHYQAQLCGERERLNEWQRVQM